MKASIPCTAPTTGPEDSEVSCYESAFSNSTSRSTLSFVSTSSTLSLPYRVWPHSPRLVIRSWKSSTVSPGLARAKEMATAGAPKLEVGVAEVGRASGMGRVVGGGWDRIP